MHVYTNAPFARILVNGVIAGESLVVPAFGAASFYNVPFVAGAVVAQAVDGPGPQAFVLAIDTKASWGAPSRIILSLDAPTPRTGTGIHDALYLDGKLCFSSYCGTDLFFLYLTLSAVA